MVIHSESPQKGNYGGTADDEVKYLSDYITRCVQFIFSFLYFAKVPCISVCLHLQRTNLVLKAVTLH
jgi:hypothetical protein